MILTNFLKVLFFPSPTKHFGYLVLVSFTSVFAGLCFFVLFIWFVNLQQQFIPVSCLEVEPQEKQKIGESPTWDLEWMRGGGEEVPHVDARGRVGQGGGGRPHPAPCCPNLIGKSLKIYPLNQLKQHIRIAPPSAVNTSSASYGSYGSNGSNGLSVLCTFES